MRRVLFIILAMIIFAPLSASAQGGSTNHTDRSYVANPKYQAMAREAVADKPDDFDFGRFRSRYVSTSQYDAFGDNVIEQMLSQAYKMQNSDNERAAVVALLAYKKLVTDHLANVAVVVQALSLSRTDRRFGNPKFFLWVRDGLMQSVIKSGDGLSLTTAYDALTLGEESLLISSLNLKLIKTDLRKSGLTYYNMHAVEDMANGENFTLFVNISRPLKRAQVQAGKRDTNFDIRRQ